MDRLKPCPFCGSKDIKLWGNHRDSFWFRCNNCASIDSYDTERQAVRAWNKRVAIPSAEPKKCKDCKWWRDSDGAYRRGVKAESKCPINTVSVANGWGYCYMFEPQESEDKE